MKTFKAFLKPFETPQRRMKTKFKLNFLLLFVIEVGRVETVDRNIQEVFWTDLEKNSNSNNRLDNTSRFLLKTIYT